MPFEREELPGEVRRAAAELEVEAKSMSWPKRRLLAKEIRRRLEHHKKQGLADAFRVLEADVKDKHDCMAVVERLELLIGKRPMHALAGDLNSWKILASGWVPAEDDPLVAAHQAAGAHRAGAITGADILNSMAELKVEAEADIFKLARDDFDPEPEKPASKPGVVVVSKIGGVESAHGKEAYAAFKDMIGKKTPVYQVPDIAAAKAKLVAEFPHAERSW